MRRAALAGALLLAAACTPSASREPALPQGEGYDFFVLALSWLPSYCEDEGADPRQCRAPGGRGFVVHGLWPQFERGWPEYCDHDEPARVPNALVRDMLDLMPSAGLVGHQWRRHGSCSGLSQRDYFALVRAARERIAIPERYESPSGRATVAPEAVEADFLAANAGLTADGIAVTCDGRLLREVRVCLTKTLEFRPCAEVDARACRLPGALMPAPD